MTPELWDRLKPLFEAAVEKPAADRQAFIATIQAEDELRRELEELIKAFEAGGSKLDSVAKGLQPMVPAAVYSLQPGDVLLGRFRIVRWLGHGGMGDVYDAFDTQLSETVALKRIRPEIAQNPDILARFKREVQLARRLTGPNLCRIHELFVGSDQRPSAPEAFLTMELLHGVTLAEEIGRNGPIPRPRAQEIAAELCSALASMHGAGIIHRDLKSRNVMLTPRNGIVRAVLMDFGLAYEVSAQNTCAQTVLTMPGTVVGTPSCMAPEQFAGGPLTPSTDIYAMGVVLYEMLTGKSPFPDVDPVRAAILRAKPPAPPSTLRPDLPRRWDNVIAKCLQFDPHDRYQSAPELSRDLLGERALSRYQRRFRAALAGTATLLALVMSFLVFPGVRDRTQGVLFASSEKHIAVLPLRVNGDNADTAALGEGLMDSLSGRLANLNVRNHSFWVVPASEIRSRKVSSVSDARRELGATMVLTGSLERQGKVVQLSLSLIDSQKLREIGSAEITTKDGDLQAIEDEAVVRLSRLFNLPVEPSDSGARAPKAEPADFEDYLTAVGYIQRYDKPGNLDAAISLLNRVVTRDPGFSLGFAQLGEAYRLKFQVDRNPHWLEIALDECKRAESAGGQTASLFITLAKIHQSMGQNELALQELHRALDLDPRNPAAVTALADAYKQSGRLADAEATYRKAIDLRPDFWDGYQTLANFYDENGRSLEAIALYRHAIQLTPDNSDLYLNLAGAYINSGNPKLFPDAESALKHSIDLNPQYQAYSNLSYLYLIEKRYSEAAATAEKGIQFGRDDYVAWAVLASAYQWQGREDKAREARGEMRILLERAVKVNPQDAQAQACLASVYAQEGMAESARQRIKTALALNSGDPLVLSDVSDAYEILLDRTSALKYTQLAFKKGLSLQDLRVDPDMRELIKDPRLILPAKD